jgi:serine/threonine-protein kinase
VSAEFEPRCVGRYVLLEPIASGGMGVVHLGRLQGPAGFSRNVAIKCLHPNLARDPEFVAMFLDEARLAARVVHPNVVPTLDVAATEGEIFVVMDYVQGESLGALVRAASLREELVPPKVASAIVANVLHGLHAAHESKNDRGEPLGIVHRDVSPQNILVGTDGIARVLDFGVAKAADRIQTTKEGRIKGKLAYMPPEQLRGGAVNLQADVYAAAVVLWEILTARRLFKAETEGAVLEKILFGKIEPPSSVVPSIPAALDAVVMRGLSSERSDRFGSARAMAIALQDALTPAAPNEVGEWVESLADDAIRARAKRLAEIDAIVSKSGATTSLKELAISLAAHPGAGGVTPVSGSSANTPNDGTGTQMSTISVSVGVPSKKAHSPRTRRAAAFAAAVVMALAVGALGLRALRGPPRPAADPAPPPPSEQPMATPPPTLLTPPPAPPASVVTDPVADAGPHRVESIRQKRRPPPAKADCTPPYTRNADGVRVYKRECL